MLKGLMSHKVTVIRGDGTGPELISAVLPVLEATGVAFDWEIMDAGENVMEKFGEPLPDQVLESMKRNRVTLKAPITTPVGKGFRSVNVRIRAELDAYANVRPTKTYKGVRTKYENVDLVVIRENIEDLYAGIEAEQGSTEASELIRWTKDKLGKTIRDDSAISLKPISIGNSERIIRFAFEYAKKHGRKKVSAVHKANIMKATDGLFLSVFQKIAPEYPEIEANDVIVDNMCMQLVQKPELYDVLVCPNLYGDIISDLASGLVGGLGVTPGANIGAEFAMFEAVHGSAPKYKGKNKVNPTAMILAGKMMLEYLGEQDAAKRLENAVAEVIAEGKDVTYDLKPNREDKGAVGTNEMARAVVKILEKK